MNKVNSVDEYILKNEKWKDELILLRDILKDTELTETIKWNAPTYTLNGNNVVGLGAFKNHFGVWFFNGALLKDKRKLLVNAQEGKTNAMRQLRFNSVQEINPDIVKEYISEAIKMKKPVLRFLKGKLKNYPCRKNLNLYLKKIKN